jgi:hypothetical protein
MCFYIDTENTKKVYNILLESAYQIIFCNADKNEKTIVCIRGTSSSMRLRFPESIRITPSNLETFPETCVFLHTKIEQLEKIGTTLAEVVETIIVLAGMELRIIDAMVMDTNDTGCNVRVRMLTEEDANILKRHIPTTIRLPIEILPMSSDTIHRTICNPSCALLPESMDTKMDQTQPKHKEELYTVTSFFEETFISGTIERKSTNVEYTPHHSSQSECKSAPILPCETEICSTLKKKGYVHHRNTHGKVTKKWNLGKDKRKCINIYSIEKELIFFLFGDDS